MSGLATANLDGAALHASRSRELFGQLGDRRGESWGLIALAEVALDDGDLEAAETNAQVALAASAATEDDRNALWAIEILAASAFHRSEWDRSARLWGAAQPLRGTRGLAGSVSKLGTPSDLGSDLADVLGQSLGALVSSGRADPWAIVADELAVVADTPR